MRLMMVLGIGSWAIYTTFIYGSSEFSAGRYIVYVPISAIYSSVFS